MKCLVAALLAAPLCAQFNTLNPVQGVEQRSDRVVFPMQTGTLEILVCTDSILHVVYSPTGRFPDRPHPAIVKTDWPGATFSLAQTATDVTLSTARMQATVTRATGLIVY